jgi:WD40 repeat protein
MSEASLRNSGAGSPLLARQVDATCDRFEQAWKAAAATIERPRIEEYLGAVAEPAHPVLLRELISLDIYYRRRHGEDPQPADYGKHVPGLDPVWLVDALASRATVTPDRSLAATLDPCLPAVPTEPPTIPGYEILGLLGSGGMAVVYKAWQTGLKRLVALKMMHNRAGATGQDVVRFAVEAEAVARLQHPHIAQIYDLGEHAGLPYFSLELLDGGSLDKKLGGVPLPAAQAAQLVETLARAVHYAHERGIVHRDLKPANVLLTADGIPKISDFGLAKLTIGAGMGQTQSGMNLGTPSYIAPEQAEGQSKAISPAADIYALGALLYELLTGRPPFRADTVLETLVQVRTEEPVSVLRLQPKVSRDLNTICMKCLQKAPHQRYARADALAEDLRRFLAREPIQARPIRLAERAVKWAKRRPALAGLVSVSIAAVLSLLVGGISFTFQLQAERNYALWQEERAKEENEKFRHTLYAAHTTLAYQAWRDGEIKRVLDLLHGEGCPPELRGWEWGYLHGLCHQDVFTLKGGHDVMSLAFSPDGRHLVTGDLAGTIRFWDRVRGQITRSLEGHPNGVRGLFYSADGRFLASIGHKEGTLKLWDTARDRPLHILKQPAWVGSVAFSPNGQELVCGGWDGQLRLLNTASGQEIRSAPAHRGYILSVAFSPDGRLVASVGMDSVVGLWKVATGEFLTPLRGHGGNVYSVVFSPDGQTLASAGEDQTVRLWDVAKQDERARLEGHMERVVSVAFSPDGRRLASGCFDKTVKLWDPATRKQLCTFRGHQDWVGPIAFSGDGRLLASGSPDGTVKLWDVESRSQEYRLSYGYGLGVFSPDGRQLATAGRDGTVRLWDATSGQEVRTLKRHTGEVVRLAFSPDGVWLASASRDQTVKLWDVASGQELHTLRGHKGSVGGVASSPDGGRLASASEDQTVKIWDVASGQELRTLEGHTGVVSSVTFSPDGAWLASGSHDKLVKLWDAASGQEVRNLQHPREIGGVAFSPNGKQLASACQDGMIRLWDLATGEVLRTLHGHTSVVSGVVFSPDGRRLASSSYDFTTKLWDTTSGHETLTLKDLSFVYSVAFSPDGLQLASADGPKLFDAAPQEASAQARLAAITSAEELLAWHQREAEASEREGQWFAVAFHLSRLIDAQPTEPQWYRRRSIAHAKLGQYDRALKDLAKASEAAARKDAKPRAQPQADER